MNIGKAKTLFKGFFDDTRAVSPIVATLVLVVVAISGAAAVGTIMGTFSSDVSGEANTGELAAASSTEILIAGSTTVQPVSELLAEAYMEDHQGIKVTVQGGGSGAGISSAGMDIVDIGAASRNVKDTELAKYPDLKTHNIGGSAVVVIADPNGNYSGAVATLAQLQALYDTTPDAAGSLSIGTATIVSGTTIVQRADASGTEDTFEDYLDLTLDAAVDDNDTTQVSETGNAGVLEKVKGTTDSIGFVDFGFAVENGLANVEILGIVGPLVTTPAVNEGTSVSALQKDIKKELKKDDGKNYVNELTRPLNYITNGEPTSMEQAFITFAMSPGATSYFEDCGYFAITSFA
jgi:phosphate transport system substrate-binding protein